MVNGELEDADLIERALESMSRYGLHVAAQAIVGVANRNPVSTFTGNIQGTWNIT